MTQKTELHCGDFREIQQFDSAKYHSCFIDPPDNLGLKYDEYNDNLSEEDYLKFLTKIIDISTFYCQTTYISFYYKYILDISHLLYPLRKKFDIRFLIQGFSFGQHRNSDFGNNYRPIVRIRDFNAPLFPDAIRIESDRMKQGDKRASNKGRVPGDVWFSDFLDYPRVTGNSKQRRSWSPTQLNEGVIEDCLLMSTPPNGSILDICSATGSCIRVCKRNNWYCKSIEISRSSCEQIAKEHNLKEIIAGIWSTLR